MTFVSCPVRDRILAEDGHLLVTGGPGCGKTTIALRKALVRIQSGLDPAQKVLFLSFSRAAVARIVEAAKDGLPRESRRHLETQTFHSFCWQIVRGHGYLLGAPHPIRLLPPHDERAMRNGDREDSSAWDAERERLFLEEGLLPFDLFAPKAMQLLLGSTALQRLVADRYPLIIVDEAQDTGTEQWGCIAVLSGLVQLVCLADLDQQIYDFRRDVSPERLTEIMAELKPVNISLGGQNNRSPAAEIVQFGNDILANRPRGATYTGVSQMSFSPVAANRDNRIRQAIGVISNRMQNDVGRPPDSIGYFATWGRGVTIVARALQGGNGNREIPHRVVMDEAEVLLATRCVALCLEPVTDIWSSLSTGLELVAELHRARGNVKVAEKLDRYAASAKQGQVRGNALCPNGLKSMLEEVRANPLTGSPAHDWLAVRHWFASSTSSELRSVAQRVIYLMAFNRGSRISDALAEVWQRKGSYHGARGLIEAAITQDQIVGGDGGLSGINVMTIHKSKGKEFDGVIVLHAGNNISPLNSPREDPPHTKSRRLLRVGVTRARHHVLLLTDASDPCPLLAGHAL